MLIHEINQLLTATTLSVGGCRREADTRRAVVGLSRVDSLTTLHFTKVQPRRTETSSTLSTQTKAEPQKPYLRKTWFFREM